MKIGCPNFLVLGAQNWPKLAQFSPNCPFSTILVIKDLIFSAKPPYSTELGSFLAFSSMSEHFLSVNLSPGVPKMAPNWTKLVQIIYFLQF